MNTPPTSRRSMGWNSRWVMVLVILLGLTAASTLVVMSFTAPDQVSGMGLSDQPAPMEMPVELVAERIDSVRTTAYDVRGKVQAMNEKFRNALPGSFKEGHVEAGPLLNPWSTRTTASGSRPNRDRSWPPRVSPGTGFSFRVASGARAT